MTDTAALVKRLEEATGGSEDLNCEIYRMIDTELPEPSQWHKNFRAQVPRYTFSLDAALTLLDQSWQWTIEADSCWVRWLCEKDVEEVQSVLVRRDGRRDGKCTALAVCIAALRARAMTQAKEQER